MQYILTGFSHVCGFRVFAFQGIAADYTRTEFTVKTDLTLIPRYKIRIQELPLLCRGLLERDARNVAQAFTFSEEEMRLCASERARAREMAPPKRRFSRKRPVDTIAI